MKKKFFFHGASVTAQSKEDSYIANLRTIMDGENSIIISSKGYGGCHFDDAGVLNLINDVNHEGDVFACVLEWNTTGLSAFSMDDISYSAGSLVAQGIVPIFLILGRIETLNKDRRAETSVIEFCKSHNVPLWDLRGICDRNDFRDDVHTNISGAKKISARLAEIIRGAALSLPEPGSITFPHRIINSTDLLEIDVIENSSLIIEIQKTSELPAVLSLKFLHGPTSGKISVRNYMEFNSWDRWSHYYRPGYLNIRPLNFRSDKIIMQLKVLPDKVDYTNCAREGFSYEGEKIFKVRQLFATNCEIRNFYIREVEVPESTQE
jgi:hypothetical protein